MTPVPPILAAAALIGLVAFSWQTPARFRPHGMIAAHSPVQWPIDDARPIPVGAFALKPRATFEFRARVLRRERYRVGATGQLMPIDIAFGWGVMSDSAVLSQLRISQSNRFYYWSYANAAPAPHDLIVQSSANMHLIPASRDVARVLFKARTGDVVRLTGQLVDVYRGDHLVMETSLTRDDSGGGACEIIYVQAAEIIE